MLYSSVVNKFFGKIERMSERDSAVVGIRGNVYNWLSYGIVGNSVCRTWESCTLAFPCAVNRVIHDSIASYAHFHNACLLVFGFLVRNSVVLAVYLLFLVSASLPYMSIIFGDETQRGGIAMKSLESEHIGLTRGDYCDSL